MIRAVATPVRTVLVVSMSPQPWALLRDRLDPELVSVAWAVPGEAARAASALRPWPFALAAEDGGAAVHGGPTGRPVLRFAVSPANGGWTAACRALRDALGRELAGVRLAASRGLLLPGGALVEKAPELEALLAAGPDGLVLTPRHVRRARASLAFTPGIRLKLAGHHTAVFLEPAG